MERGTILKVAGPLVVAEGLVDSKMFDLVRVGEEGLMGEIIEMRGDRASIQVYEETEGLGPGDPVEATGAPLSVELGPGMLEAVYDGVQRPLDKLEEQAGAFLTRGISAPGLDREKRWEFTPVVEPGARVEGGDIIGTVQENEVIEHRILVPPFVAGTIADISAGSYTVTDPVGHLTTDDGERVELIMMQVWPVRTPRPYKKKISVAEPLTTGTRVIDTFFPLTKGGVACIPGPFGAGKTVTQHQIAKWSNAEVVIFIGCGERGNEMTDVLMEFPELEDPYSGEPLLKRTVLVANTSNMPVAAREASVYTGITMAEYFRDMGYSVALMADSTSRWAEAMREISTRLEEMPAEEGYPAYLGARIASFYERAGKVVCTGSPDRQGALSIIGAVSPPGGDLSDSVVQATLHVVKVFWSLQGRLAQQRHFPAIDWLTSYSFYKQYLPGCFEDKDRGEAMAEMTKQAMGLLEEEAQLIEIVRLVGAESIGARDRMVLETAKSIREDFLHQNAFHKVDTHTSMDKQFEILKAILYLHAQALEAIEQGVDVKDLCTLPVRTDIARAKFVEEQDIERIVAIRDTIDEQIKGLSVPA